MSDIDKRLDEIIKNYSAKYYQIITTGASMNLINNHLDKYRQAIKQLMAEEFEKMISETKHQTGYCKRLETLRQKLEEWKK